MWQKDAHVQVMQGAWPGVFGDEIARERAVYECRGSRALSSERPRNDDDRLKNRRMSVTST